MIILGIVGAPAGGKSTVAARLQELGATWINADQIARSVLEEDEVQAQLIAHFGPEITGSDGRVDRKKLANLVFGDDDEKRAALTYLEGLTHPRTGRLIKEKLRDLEKQNSGVAVLEIPLLFEGGWDRVCDEIWCVDSDRSSRLARAKERGWNDEHLRQRESNQIDLEEKKRLSTVIICNNGTLAELQRRVDDLWRSLLERHGEP